MGTLGQLLTGFPALPMSGPLASTSGGPVRPQSEAGGDGSRKSSGGAAGPPNPPHRLPPWFKVRPPEGQAYASIKMALRERGLSTVCEEARCPNLAECWSGGQSGVGTATIMVMGDTCTRGCRFCSVATGRPGSLDPEEPTKVAETVGIMGVGYVVITSVDRDDLPDGGADHFGAVIQECKRNHPQLVVEVLTPDFQGDPKSITRIVNAGPDVVAHNIETVRRLSARVRDRRADHDQSLGVLKGYKDAGAEWTKSSIMVGLGETMQEVEETMRELRDVDCDILTIGQYLRPTKMARHLPVAEYIHPDVFGEYRRLAEAMGFRFVASGPLVRSSYRAGELFMEGMVRSNR